MIAKTTNKTQVVIKRDYPFIKIWITSICILLSTVDCGETCVFTELQDPRWSHGVGSPWTAMFFLSCRIAFPADTCTVTVLMPSWENVHATLPSRVISGCWGRMRERERETEKAGQRETESQSLGGSGERPLSTAGLTPLLFTHKYTHTHGGAYTESFATICAVLDTVSGATESFLCDTGSSFLSLLMSPFVLQIAIRC